MAPSWGLFKWACQCYYDMRCGALTHNYATNACCCAKKSDKSLNPTDMTAQ